jgi:hypothetical protein
MDVPVLGRVLGRVRVEGIDFGHGTAPNCRRWSGRLRSQDEHARLLEQFSTGLGRIRVGCNDAPTPSGVLLAVLAGRAVTRPARSTRRVRPARRLRRWTTRNSHAQLNGLTGGVSDRAPFAGLPSGRFSPNSARSRTWWRVPLAGSRERRRWSTAESPRFSSRAPRAAISTRSTRSALEFDNPPSTRRPRLKAWPSPRRSRTQARGSNGGHATTAGGASCRPGRRRRRLCADARWAADHAGDVRGSA